MASGATGGALQHNPDLKAQLPRYGAASATAWAENVASWSPAGSYSAQAIFNSYMASPGHRANIMNSSYRYVGVASVANGAGGAFNTQNFTNKIDAPVHQSPIGNFDAATPSGNTVTVTGWTLEPSNKSATTQVHVYINATGYILNTTTPRPDVNNAYGATGTHGFRATLPLPTGTNTICAYAVSTIGNGNTLLSCRTVTGNSPPIGNFDAATPSGNTVTVAGWTLEPSNKSATTQVHVYINATATSSTPPPRDPTSTTPTAPPAPTASAPPSRYPPEPTPSAPTPSPPSATATPCSAAAPSPATPHPSETSTPQHLPATPSPSPAGPWNPPTNPPPPKSTSTSTPTGYILNTTTPRPDVNNAYGATGNHGFRATLPLPTGTSTICAYAVSTIGNGNTLLSCRTVQRS